MQPREGRLHVFMPPLPSTESYLDLVSAIEATAGELAMPVIIEGETPPRDPRIERISVTPDPGVIEVNIHPSRSWDELVDRTTTLYEEARQTRLCAEKFMLDGRHTGTGGGNHIVLGGETPLEVALSEGKQIGYRGFELGNKFPREPAALRIRVEEDGRIRGLMQGE